jgi:predicted RNA binding protein YcfA (HicA-like mRNA interferase family)
VSPRLRRLSGQDVISILAEFGFNVHSQRGSHVKLRRFGPAGEKQTLTIPVHRELDIGTLRAIIRQAARYISEDELRSHFYSG